MLSSPSCCVRARGRRQQGVPLRWAAQSGTRRCFVATLLLVTVMLLLYVSSDLPATAWTGTGPCPDNHSASEERDGSDAPPVYVPYPHHYSLIIDEPKRCQQGAPFLVLMVPVAPSDRMSRDAIRRTWGRLPAARGRRLQQYFLLGSTSDMTTLQQQILAESRLHHDIIQSNFVDSYQNLTLKTMLMFEWLSSHCPSSAYAMKVDSDIFLNVNNLVELLLDAPRRSYMTGLVKWSSVIIRDKRSKWYLPCSMLPELYYYPPYVLGLGYVFSMDMPQRILDVSARVKAVYIEDVYVGLCLRELGVAPSDPPYGHLFRAGLPLLVTHCYWGNVITTIMRDSQHLLETWETHQKRPWYC